VHLFGSSVDNTNTFTQRLYVHFDPDIAYKYSIARQETERLWQESLDKQDDSIATAVAGAVLFLVYGTDGGKCLHMIRH